MKKIFGALLALVSSVAFGTTLVPIQLLNPTGSSSGQAIVSTGGSSAPAWGGVGVNGIAAIAANTVLANATGSSASPTAFAMPSCSTSSSILQYTTSAGFTCSTTIWASPPAIGGTAAAAGSFTTLNASGLISPTSTIGIKGTTTNDNAQAGSFGEYPSPTNLSTVPMTSGVAANVSSVSLSAGDWDVQCDAVYTPAGSTVISGMLLSVSTTSNTMNFGVGFLTAFQGITTGAGLAQFISSPVVRESVSTTTTVYCVASAGFSTSTLTASGFLRARRIR